MEIKFRGLPQWLLAEYLVELGGVADGDSQLQGAGWQARLSQQTVRLGAFELNEATVRFDAGPAAARLAEMLRRKAMRGGG